MPERPFIFVSHSSENDALTREVCSALESGSGQDQYRALIDYEGLKGGVSWPLYLIEWMLRCHSAIVLLTKEAIPRPWVLKEATILAARRALDPNFRVFFVEFPGTATLLEQHGYSPLQLRDVQQVTFTDAGALAATIFEEVRPLTRGQTPFEEMVSKLRDLLSSVGASALESVASKLDVVPAHLAIGQSDRDRWIDTIARNLVCGKLGAFAGVHELIDSLNGGRRDIVEQILDRVAPYWIDPEAASRLLVTGARGCAAALNGTDVADFTARLYVWRAHQPSLLFQVLPISECAHDQYVEHVTGEICEWMRVRRRFPALLRTNDQIVAALKTVRREYYAVLPPPVPDEEAMNELLEKFPHVTFICWTGESLTRDRTLTRVEWLTPPVDVAREWKEREDYESAKNVIAHMPHS